MLSPLVPNILQGASLVKQYKKKSVVQGIDFQVQSGQVVGLLGPNGAGKTTSFYMMVGLITPDQGRILLNQQDITSWTMPQRAQGGIAYLPQEASIFRKMTVLENLLCALETLSLSSVQKEERLNELLDEFHLRGVLSQKGLTLSGGERRRVEIARALARQPHFLLLDEPFAGIDPLAVADIQKTIAFLKTKQLGILITDHNVRETLKICDWGYLLHHGKIVEQGTPLHIAASPLAQEAYLGKDFALTLPYGS